MKNRAVRIALFLLAVLAFAGAGYELVLLEKQAAAAREAAGAFQQKAQRLVAAVRELHAAEYAYVAHGQGSDYWTARAATLLAFVSAELPGLCGAVAPDSSGRAASASCAEAQSDLASIERIDANARAYVRDAQAEAASGIVFGDLRAANQALATHIDEVRSGQAAADAEAAATVRTRQVATVGGTALFAVLILLLLTPRAAPRATAAPGSNEPQGNAHSPLIGLSRLADDRPPHTDSYSADTSVSVRAPSTSAKVAHGQATIQMDTPAERPARTNAVGAADLSEAAGLCTAFAQLQQATDLPALLERLAGLLDAAGIVVWVADPAGAELRPAVSYGYPPHVLARMRGISKDDDHATAVAFRDRGLRVVARDGSSNGAIAVPLLAPGSCVGVMAAEIRGGREHDRSMQALAVIVAAQLATLVNPQAATAEADSDFKLQLE